MQRNLKEVSKEDIEGFVYELIKKSNISESYQNQLINAIKAYYEHALKMPREYYDIQRPKKATTIPNVLSKSEVLNIIQAPKNIKHKAILYTIYSAGLRISELINLRIADVHSKDGYLFIKDSKGKKDRKTILSQQLVVLLRAYYKEYKDNNALSSDFQKTMEEVSGEDLETFFDQWLYQKGYPEIKWNWKYKKGKLIIKLDQLQKHTTFQFPVEFGVSLGGEIKMLNFEIDKSSESLEVELDMKPDEVMIDPEVWLLFDER